MVAYEPPTFFFTCRANKNSFSHPFWTYDKALPTALYFGHFRKWETPSLYEPLLFGVCRS